MNPHNLCVISVWTQNYKSNKMWKNFKNCVGVSIVQLHTDASKTKSNCNIGKKRVELIIFIHKTFLNINNNYSKNKLLLQELYATNNFSSYQDIEYAFF